MGPGVPSQVPVPGDALGLVLSKLENVRRSGRGWSARCPVAAHDDHKNSLSVDPGDIQPIVINCHKGCSYDDILAVLGLTRGDLSASAARDGSVVVAEYRYTDEAGGLLFVKERYEPKDFRIRRPNGRGGWAWGLGRTLRVLYRLPEITRAISEGRPVFIAEGEKDVHALEAVGAVATTNFEGASEAGRKPKLKAEYADMLAGADATVVADDDDAGHAHARAWAELLDGKAASVRLVLPARGCKDAHDHLGAGHGLGDFRSLDDGDDGLPHLPAIPGYPVSMLTGAMREIVDAGTVAGLPAALVGGAALSALAAVCGNAELAIYDTWTVHPCLWTVLIAPTGGGKTPAMTFTHRRLRKLDAERHRLFADQLKIWEEMPAKDRKAEDTPSDETRLIRDITIEMTARWLAAGDGTGGVDMDELSEWLGGLSRYRKDGGSDNGKYLALWSCQAWRYQRVTGGVDILVERPVLSICGGIQPHLLRLLGPEGDGMRPGGCLTYR